jgi:hypothetical protein
MDLIRLTRPIDLVLLLAAAIRGGWLAGSPVAFMPTVLGGLFGAAVAATLVGAGANVVSDPYGVDVATLPVVLGRCGASAVALLVVSYALAALPFNRAGYDELSLACSIPPAVGVPAGAWALLSADALGQARPTHRGKRGARSSSYLKVGPAVDSAGIALGR